MRIVFMGTPDFAVPCLAALIDSPHEVVGVFSQPDRPKGRGYQLVPTPVKTLAAAHGIPVFQPEKLRDGTALEILRQLAPDLIVVVAYGRILPPEILALPALGCINVHASLLPKLRGAAPIQWSVINGDTVTGVTTMFMAERLDTGDLILVKQTPILHDETAGELFVRLAALGAQALTETAALLAAGTAPRTPQQHEFASHAPMLDKKLANLDFTSTAKTLCNLIRGLNPAPMAFTRFGGKMLKVLQAKPAPGFSGQPFAVLDTKRLIIGCGDGAVELLTVQPEGKAAMSGAAFACGKRLCGGELLTMQ